MIGAEDRFWMANEANNISLKQVLCGQFHRMDVTGWFVNVEGLSSDDYDNRYKVNDNTDNKKLKTSCWSTEYSPQLKLQLLP